MKEPVKKPLSAVNVFAVILGIFLVIIGFWGFVSPVAFGFLSTNVLHATIQLVLGFTAIYSGLRNHARRFSLYAGILFLLLGILYFIPGTDVVIIDLLNVNTAVAVLYSIIGITAILFALLTPKKVAMPAPKHK